MCDYLVPHITRLLLIPLSSERTVDPQEVDAYCRSKWPDLPITHHLTLANALDATTSDPFVIIAGSLHLIGEAMELLHISPSLRSERSLNEWNAANSSSTSTASGS
jgi:folylpolyglutamate synthase/dihydropteroate synthase